MSAPGDVLDGRAKWAANQGEWPGCAAGIADDTLDASATDPPYELGFMGKAWDRSGIAFRPSTWAEVLRVLKPGAHLVAFGGSRTYHRIAVAIEDAGFEIRDTIAWCYGSGFPKSLNLGDGRGTALKPAYEPIIVARKPLRGTVTANVERFGTGAINVDACRVRGDEDGSRNRPPSAIGSSIAYAQDEWTRSAVVERRDTTGKGRWPPNLLLSHAPGCVEIGTRDVGNGERRAAKSGAQPFAAARGWNDHSMTRDGQTAPESYGQETIAAWRCVEGCPVKMLDEQSGERGAAAPTSGPTRTGESSSASRGRFAGTDAAPAYHADTGTASRFFPQFPADDFDPFYYTAKAARSERERGLKHLPARSGADAVGREEGSAGVNNPRAGAGRTAREVRNFHPTVKPIAVMRWLVRLITPPGGTVIDPFMGSGTTGAACMEERLRFVGFDIMPEHVEIARGRIAYHDRYREPQQESLFGASP